MNPIAFTLGPLTVRWYGLLISSAMLIGYFGANHYVKKQGLDQDNFLSVILWTIIIGVLGARAYYVIFNLSYYSAHPSEIIAIWHGGLAIHGGILGGLIAGYLSCRHYKLDFWQTADIISPWSLWRRLSAAGATFSTKKPTATLLIPMSFPGAMYIERRLPFPTRPFSTESIWDLCTFMLLMYLNRKSSLKQGESFLAYLIPYSAIRFLIETLRTDSLMLGSLRMAQVMSVVLIIIAVSLIIYRRAIKI